MEKRCSFKSCFGGWIVRNCKRKGIIQREGELYCKQHDPVALKAKRDAEERKYQEQRQKGQEARNRRAVLEKLAEGIETKDLCKYKLTRSTKEK